MITISFFKKIILMHLLKILFTVMWCLHSDVISSQNISAINRENIRLTKKIDYLFVVIRKEIESFVQSIIPNVSKLSFHQRMYLRMPDSANPGEANRGRFCHESHRSLKKKVTDCFFKKLNLQKICMFGTKNSSYESFLRKLPTWCLNISKYLVYAFSMYCSPT